MERRPNVMMSFYEMRPEAKDKRPQRRFKLLMEKR